MRHQKKRHKLGRTAAHRKATLAALAAALIEHKRIETTLPKAKALRVYVEPIITRAKTDSTHNRREAFRHLGSKEAVKELFGEVAAKVGDRPGGYTRVVRLGQRHGDAADMAVIELVDWNDVRPDGAGTRKKTRRSGRTRRGSGKKGVTPPPAEAKATPQAQAAPEEAPAPAEPAPNSSAGADPAPPQPAAQEGSTGTHDAPKVAAHPEQNEHPDPQGADPGTGEPAPEMGKGDQGVAGGSRHRG